jgi:hypothetical protein
MVILWERGKGEAKVYNLGYSGVYKITSDVRNELNGRRGLHDPGEVVNIVQANGTWGHAYMPRPFPLGKWKITGIERTSAPVFAPVKIKTNAHQKVELWNLDRGGGYDKPSGIYAEDYGYHLHWSACSGTTLGCGRVGRNSAKEVLALAAVIEEAFKFGEPVVLEVV